MTLLAGYITAEEAETSDPTLGIEFEPENNRAVVYIDEGTGDTEVALTYEQVTQFSRMVSQVESQMEWHMASWVYAYSFGSNSIRHLMKKGEHGEFAKALCGRKPTQETFLEKWQLAPVLKEPWHGAGMCKRCLAKYDKLIN